MAISLVQAKSGQSPTAGQGTGTTLTITLTSSTTAGNCLVVTYGIDSSGTNGTVSGITLGGSAGNFASAVTGGSTTNYEGGIWADPNCAGGQTSVVLTMTGGTGTQFIQAYVYEFSGLATSSVTDKTNSNNFTGSSMSWTSNATTTLAQATEVFVGHVTSFSSSMTGPASPWTNETELSNATEGVFSLSGYNIVSATTGLAYAGSAGTSTSYLALVASFKGSSGTPATVNLTTPNLQLDAPALSVDAGARVSLTAPNLALGAPVPTIVTGPSLTTPNLALAAPPLSVSAGATVSLTAPNIQLAAPALQPQVPATVNLTTPNIQLAAPSLAPAAAVEPVLLASWAATYARDPIVFAAGPPAITPLAVQVSNTAGNWMFAQVSWRQDAGTAGDLQYPSTVTVSDDAANFWIPVYSGLPSTLTQANGIVRCAVWMAPAAKAASYVFVSPTAYQSSLTVLITEFEAACPWYEVAVLGGSFTDQGTSITLSEIIPTTVFALAVMAWDNLSGSVTPSASGWTALPVVVASNGTDDSGDLQQNTWYLSGTGGSLTVSASGSPTMDWAEIIIAVHGVTDLLPFPYAMPVENWPVLVTEIASAPNLNQDPTFAAGTTFWDAGTDTSIVAVSWPQWQPIPASYQPALYGSLQVVPDGLNTQAYIAAADLASVSALFQYNAVAWVYSPQGWGSTATGNGVYVGINWFDVTQTYISTFSSAHVVLEAGEWTQLSLPAVTSPSNAAYATVVVTEVDDTGANLPAAAVFYVAYAGFSAADAYEAIPPDEFTWTDVSARNFTQGQMQIARGIQYEQQSLEAGTLAVFLTNLDGDMTFGNVLSPFWPNIGDTDVPIRVRAIWPESVTPYAVLFSGYTDDIKYGWDTSEDTWYGFAQVTASDGWSRLTQQMVSAIQQEQLLDNPIACVPCNATGTNLALGQFSTVPAASIPSPAGANTTTASFTGSGVSINGATGLQCWQSGGTQAADIHGMYGWALTWFPPTSLPLTGGMTVEFFFSPVSNSATQPGEFPTLIACAGSSVDLWKLSFDNFGGGGGSNNGTLQVTVFDKDTNVGTTTSLGTFKYYSGTNATTSYYCAVTFNQTTLTALIIPVSASTLPTQSVTVSTNMAATCTGFTLGGESGPAPLPRQTFGDLAVSSLGIYQGIVPAARLADHFQAGETAFGPESDNWRLARIASYSGFIPQLGMRGSDLPAVPARDVDLITGATDTNTQVVSAYFTNIASSTDAVMFVDGPGALIYRRRMEWYDRRQPQWAMGELPPVPLNLNGFFTNGTTGYHLVNGASLAAVNAPPAVPAQFFPTAGLLTGNGSTSGPGAMWFGSAAGAPVTPGAWYQVSVWVYSPQGYLPGTQATASFYDAFLNPAGSAPSVVISVAPNSATFLTVAEFQVPSGVAWVAPGFSVNGTPASSVQFYVAGITLTELIYTEAAGAGGKGSVVGAGFATPALAHSAGNKALSGSSITITVPSTTAGNAMIICGVDPLNGNVISGVTLGGSAAGWQFISAQFQGSAANANMYIACWANFNIAGGQTSVVVSFAGSGWPTAQAFEVSGLATTSTVDQIAGQTVLGGGAAWSSTGTAATTQPSEFVLGYMGGFNDAGGAATITGPGSPWTNETVQQPNSGVFLASGYMITTSTGSFTYSGTSTMTSPNNFYSAQVVTFKAAPISGNSSLVLYQATATGETPYLPDVTLSSDRAQLFNYAVITQYGTNLISAFSGTGVTFTPSSGVIVIIGNQPSIAQRGQVPYTATVYLDNTVQATPFYPGSGSIEDFANWITQTLGSPLFRPDQVRITPAATPPAMLMGLQAEIGDTVTYRRRPIGAQEIQVLTYVSKLEHTIDISKGQWEIQYELSPYPSGQVLVCDDVIHGVLTGDNLLGW